MSAKVRISLTEGGKTNASEGEFASLIAAVKFAGDYMTLTPRRHRGLTAVHIEIVEVEPAKKKRRAPRATEATSAQREATA